MANRPLVGVICCTRFPEDPIQGVAERYLRAVPFMDAGALLVPSMRGLNDPESIVSVLDGLMLTGSPSNIEPARYNSSIDGDAPVDPARDHSSLGLIEAAVNAGKPVLGICRGFQEIAVRYGSTLQKGLGEPGREQVHHTPPGVPLAEMFALEHSVHLTPGGLLQRAIGETDIVVNSVHFQGVSRLGAELVVEATSADGIVEAIRPKDGARVLGVQWHPEWRVAENEYSKALFGMFGLLLRGATLDEAADEIGRKRIAAAGAGVRRQSAAAQAD